MIEPTDPQERAAAIRICRANAQLNAKTGKPLELGESERQWRQLQDDLPYKKWIWMWNYGRQEWDPAYTADQVGTAREG